MQGATFIVEFVTIDDKTIARISALRESDLVTSDATPFSADVATSTLPEYRALPVLLSYVQSFMQRTLTR